MAKIYNIPANFKQSGYVFNGLIETRKAIEAGCGAVLGYLLCKLLPLPKGVVSISFYVFFCLTFALIGFVGVRGEPVSTFLVYMFRWRKIRKKPYFYNPNGEAYSVTAAQIHLEEPAMQDALADMFDKLRSNFTAMPPEYVEGETFQFASDPLLERLKYAQDQRHKDDAFSVTADTETESPPAAVPMDSGLNIDSLINDITLSVSSEGDNNHG